MKYISTCESDTLKLAAEVADGLKGGEVIRLIGDLGSGKTVFSKGLAAALGVKEPITSPTFAIMNIYDSGRIKLCHCDAYRLSGAEDAADIAEFFGHKEYVSLIEWPQKIEEALEGLKTITVSINYISENTREIIIE